MPTTAMMARYELYLRIQRTVEGVEYAPISGVVERRGLGRWWGRRRWIRRRIGWHGHCGRSSCRGPTGGAMVTSMLSVIGWPSAPTSRQRSEMAPG